MKDHYDHDIDPRDLTKRLNRIQKSHSTPNDGDSISRLPRLSREGTTSSDPSSHVSRLPTFQMHKSPTQSTTASSSTQGSHLHAHTLRSTPLAQTCKSTAEVEPGAFSKPRIGRQRRESGETAKSVPEFQYYGRHANTWLFNDFSVTDSVKKGWERVVKGKRET